jgi:hypothetical protein
LKRNYVLGLRVQRNLNSGRRLVTGVALSFYSVFKNAKSRGSSVGMATDYGLDHIEVGVPILVRSRIFNSPYRADRLWDLINLLSNLRWELSLGIKRPGHEADY